MLSLETPLSRVSGPPDTAQPGCPLLIGSAAFRPSPPEITSDQLRDGLAAFRRWQPSPVTRTSQAAGLHLRLPHWEYRALQLETNENAKSSEAPPANRNTRSVWTCRLCF